MNAPFELPSIAIAEPKRPIHSPASILVVEDEAMIRRYYCAVLSDSGFQVDTAEDGAVAWNLFCLADADAPTYDLLITDNNMPKLTGLELIGKLRAAQTILPIILATGAVPSDAQRLDVAAILQKPVCSDRLIQIVREVLQLAKCDLDGFALSRS
jgi:DNA-binding response OmpR family regulator